MPINKSVLSLDVGGKRVGLAIASLDSRLPRPYKTLIQDDNFIEELTQITRDEEVESLIIGLPRNLEGQTTQQTVAIAKFTKELKKHIDLPIYFQDEAVTSKQAEAELQSRHRSYEKSDIDALAATYILEDWLNEHKEIS